MTPNVAMKRGRLNGTQQSFIMQLFTGMLSFIMQLFTGDAVFIIRTPQQHCGRRYRRDKITIKMQSQGFDSYLLSIVETVTNSYQNGLGTT